MIWLKSKSSRTTDLPRCIIKVGEGHYQFEFLQPGINIMWKEEVENIKEYWTCKRFMLADNPNKNPCDLIDFDNILSKLTKDVV